MENLCELAGLTGCSSHGVCGQGTGVALCTCDVGYTGTTCGDCAPNYFRNTDSLCVQHVTLRIDVSDWVWKVMTGLAAGQAVVYFVFAALFWRLRSEYVASSCCAVCCAV